MNGPQWTTFLATGMQEYTFFYFEQPPLAPHYRYPDRAIYQGLCIAVLF